MPRPEYRTDEEIVHSMIRVNHAGEYGAIRMYQGQIDASKKSNDLEFLDILEDMLIQEQDHFEYFNNLINERGISKTKFLKYWHYLSYAIGFCTAKLGKEEAMLCTEAVEEVIDIHYQKQIDKLKFIDNEDKLLDIISKFRKEELEHKAIASNYTVCNRTKDSAKNTLLKKAIGFACKLAIKLSK